MQINSVKYYFIAENFQIDEFLQLHCSCLTKSILSRIPKRTLHVWHVCVSLYIVMALIINEFVISCFE